MDMTLIDPNKFTGNLERYGVPRVTEILSAMLHEDYLMEWSNAMGLYKHLKYRELLDTYADIGTYTHKAIELYLSEGKDLDINECPIPIRSQVISAFSSFKEWWDIIKKNDYEILMQETPLVCKYFGGTLDLYIKINGKCYIVDFKTSNHSSYKHFLQVAAYRYMLKEKGYAVNGCVILRLDKKSCDFTEYLLDFDIPMHMTFINCCEECFLSLVYSYYNRNIISDLYKKIF